MIDADAGNLAAPAARQVSDAAGAATGADDDRPRGREGSLVRRRGRRTRACWRSSPDHMLLIEAPNDERVRAVLAKAKELRPNKPVTTLLVTHHHADHTGGCGWRWPKV